MISVAGTDVSGLPIISICCGFSSPGLPIGMQVAAPSLEDVLFQVAHVNERAAEWYRRNRNSSGEPRRSRGSSNPIR
jgi:Asp-tRNA(Asn)/Glu-tRNA(Gln) amidotransferase A subunit family amidase